LFVLYVQYVLEEKNKHRCPRCGDVLADEKALRFHRASGFCREDKDERTLRTLRVARQNEAKAKAQRRRRLVVQAKVETHEGVPIKAVAAFKYLGTQLDNCGGTTGEILRRTGMAKTVVRQLRSVWRDHTLPRHLKATLYGSLVSSVALYNAECWSMTEADWKILRAFQLNTLKTVAGEEQWKTMLEGEGEENEEEEEERQRTSRLELCGRLGIVDVETQLKEKRVAWAAHTARDKQEGTFWLIQAEVNKRTPWGKQLLKDVEEYGWTLDGLSEVGGAKELRELLVARRPIAAAKREDKKKSRGGRQPTKRAEEARRERRERLNEQREEAREKREAEQAARAKILIEINGRRWVRIPGEGDRWKVTTESGEEVEFEVRHEHFEENTGRTLKNVYGELFYEGVRGVGHADRKS